MVGTRCVEISLCCCLTNGLVKDAPTYELGGVYGSLWWLRGSMHWMVDPKSNLTGFETGRQTSAFVPEARVLQVRINPGSRARIERPTLVFDWLGLALYRPDDADDRIDWLFDDAFPVHGILHQDSDEAIYFGDIAFTVGKSATERATNFTFYLTSEGILYVFGLL